MPRRRTEPRRLDEEPPAPSSSRLPLPFVRFLPGARPGAWKRNVLLALLYLFLALLLVSVLRTALF